MLHPDEGTIHAWLDDQLASEERARLDEHFDHCEQCAVHVMEARGLVAGASRIVGGLDGVRSGVVPTNSGSPNAPQRSAWRSLRLTPMRAALAATLLLATGTIFTIRSTSSGVANSTTMPKAEQIIRPAVAAAPPPSVSVPAAGKAGSNQALAEGRTSPAVVASQKPASIPSVPQAQPSLSSVVATGAVVLVSRDCAHADSVAVPARDAVANVESKRVVAAAAAPQEPRPIAIERAFVTGRVRSTRLLTVPTLDQSAIGCYRLEVDSSSVGATGLRQFSLERFDSTGARVVRGLSEAGGSGSVIRDAAWRSVSGDSVLVVSPVGEQRAQLVFAAGKEGQQTGGRLTSAGQTTPIVVLRTKCR